MAVETGRCASICLRARRQAVLGERFNVHKSTGLAMLKVDLSLVGRQRWADACSYHAY